MISREQIRGARAMLELSQDMLAEEAGVSPATVFNLEKGQLSVGSANKIRAALERRGIAFIGSTGINRVEQKRIIFEGP
ncbi:helix-turn-helix transcriptional regulator, partial [Vibrio parahaemolyticus]